MIYHYFNDNLIKMSDVGIIIIIVFVIIALLFISLLFYTVIPLSPRGMYLDGLTYVPYPSEEKSTTWSDVLASPAFIINIERSKERYPICEQRVKFAGFQDVRHYIGVDGKYETLSDKWARHGVATGSFHSKFAKHKSEQGCYLSHLGVLKEAIDRGYPLFTIFEDDVMFDVDFNRLSESYFNATPSDFDMIYLGSLTILALGGDQVIRCWACGTHAITYTHAGAQKVYDFLTRSPEIYALDVMLAQNYYTHRVPIQHYNWNYKRLVSFGNTGLVFQDRTMGTTIQNQACK